MPYTLVKMLEEYASKGTKTLFIISLVVSCIYGFVLSIFGGTVVWISLGQGLSYTTTLTIAVAFFGLEFALISFKKPAPGVLITALIMIPCAHARGLKLKWSQAPSEVMKSLNYSSNLVRANNINHAQ